MRKGKVTNMKRREIWNAYHKAMAIHDKACEECNIEKMRFAWKVSRTLWAIATQHTMAKSARLKAKYPEMFKH